MTLMADDDDEEEQYTDVQLEVRPNIIVILLMVGQPGFSTA